MRTEITQDVVVSYYNEHTRNKLKDYIKANPRIEDAWRSIVRYAPSNPVRILEVGCGIGGICARMHRQWPGASIKGIDISPSSIQIANKLFSNKKVSFLAGTLTPSTFEEDFDMIVFMDVYEHISVNDRPVVHAALKKILKDRGRLFLSVPTPHNLKWSLKHKPETMQPVDEFISFNVIGKLAEDTGTEVLRYDIRNIWNTGDYAHIVLERNSDFEGAFFYPKPVTPLQRFFRVLNKVIYKLGSLKRRAYVLYKLK